VTPRRVAGAVVVVLVYVALASLSGWLSPIARRPVLDGLGPVAPYQWVSPPPELAEGNLPPSAGDFEVRLTPDGSEAGVFLTTDTQVTVVVDRGAFPPHGPDNTVRLTVTPLDPITLGALPSHLTAFGNALEVRAAYEPSGQPVRRFAEPLDVVTIYPVTQTLHASVHALQHSADGTTWTELDSLDAPGLQQLEASVREPGFLVVAGELTPNPITTPGGGTDPLVAVLLVGSAGALLAGAALLVRARAAK
jgi:hypothetical protein